jgi:hypothetical protein
MRLSPFVRDPVETSDMPKATERPCSRTRRTADCRDCHKNGRGRNVDSRKNDHGRICFRVLGIRFGVVRNAYDPRRTPAVPLTVLLPDSVNFAGLGIGEDTGGSIRGPVAGNSLVGQRPTVSRYGMLP